MPQHDTRQENGISDRENRSVSALRYAVKEGIPLG